MKLIRWMNGSKAATGVIINEEYFDTSSFGEDYNESFFENDGLDRLEKFVESTKANWQNFQKIFN